jgi:hypothetical protein
MSEPSVISVNSRKTLPQSMFIGVQRWLKIPPLFSIVNRES